MYRVLILGLLAGLAAASTGTDDKCVCHMNIAPDRSRHHGLVDAAATRLLAVRVDSMEVRMNEGSKKLEKLSGSFDTLSGHHDKGEKMIKKLEARLSHLEGSDCPEGHFQCGGLNKQCITNLLVCDKHKDCANGADEDSHRCHPPAGTGSVWEAHLHGDEGCTQRRVTKIRLVITKETTLDFVPALTRVKASAIITHSEDGQHSTQIFNVDGVFRPALLEVEFFPPEDDQIGIKCTFDGVDNGHCVGTFTHGHGSCGHFTFSHVEH